MNRKGNMNTKLTLTIEKSTIRKAKLYARKKGKSLSGIVQNYLEIVARDSNETDIELTPIVRSLKGAFTAPADFDYRKALSGELSKKYRR